MAGNLFQALTAAAESGKGIYFVEASDKESFLPYHELQQQALAVLAQMQARGVRAGDELVFQYDDLRSLILTYWACVAGAVIPVPLEYGDQANSTEKVFSVWKILQSPWLAVDTPRAVEKLASFAQERHLSGPFAQMQSRLLMPVQEMAAAVAHGATLPGGVAIPPVDSASPAADPTQTSPASAKATAPGAAALTRFDPAALNTLAQAAQLAPLAADDIAFIQFSSGSTGSPKGVTMTHSNLLTNIGDILASVNYAEGDRFLTWKPITHDFGMIAFHLAPIVAIADQVRINTDAFIWNPALWFAMVDKYRASILGSPNFGYRHFLKLFRRPRTKKPDWDLSCVKVILNGAEPISEELCNEFTQELGKFRMPHNVMTPGYGLAEGSLISSLCRVEEDHIISINVDRRALQIGSALRLVEANAPEAVNFVDCGIPYPNTAIRITDEARQPLPENHVGQIEIRGGSVTKGYYLNPQASSELINAEGWLNTQDMGVLRNGRLYVVGRIKEMIIIGGVNYFPYDIETAILGSKGENQLNQYIACGVTCPHTGSEQLLIFVYFKKTEADFAPIAAEIRQLLNQNFGLQAAHVLPVVRIPKTTSGKIQRFKLVQDFLDGKFDEALRQMGETRSIGVATPGAAAPGVATTPISSLTASDSHQTAAPASMAGQSAGSASVSTDALADPASDIENLDLLARTREVVEKLLGQPTGSLAARLDTSFFELGFSSLRLVNLKLALEDAFGLELDSTSALDFPNIRSMARHISQQLANLDPDCANQMSHGDEAQAVDNDIAIVGVACRFPGPASHPQAYWDLLFSKTDPVRPVPPERWRHDPQGGQPLATREGGFLENLDQFDPLFFGISPAEALSLDPQQRLLLEVCHEAIENAGWHPDQLQGSRTAVYIGISGTEYAQVGRDLGHGTGPYTFTGGMFNAAAGRISYTFGLHGPSMAVDTACSSSLVAVAQGMRELRCGASDIAIAGGVSLILKVDGHVSFSRLNALSETGRCRSFDDSADGYIRGEGCGILILKRLRDAERDGDTILAVLKGCAINHNGRSGGLTVPSGPAQERLITEALQDAHIDRSQIDYVEAHGSGTRLGDPQELHALARVFGQRSEPVMIGSVKSNLGHLEAAAGSAGLIKLALMLHHKTMLPNLHFKTGNSLVDWSKTALRVVSEAQPWPKRPHRRSAGISSFGISGTNAHLVLQEYLPANSHGKLNGDSETGAPHASEQGSDHALHHAPRSTGSFVFTLSAKSASGLQLTQQIWASEARLASLPFGELCRSVNLARSGYEVRWACVASSFAEVQKKLGTALAKAKAPASKAATSPTVFMYTGQGSVYPGIGRQLYQSAPVFQAAFNRCAELFEEISGRSLRELIFAEAGSAQAQEIDSPAMAQPLIFSIEYSLTRWWAALGVRPDIVLGHSIGEYMAACEAGVITLPQAVAMVALRGRIMQESEANGAMAGILADEGRVRALLAEHQNVYLAAVNTPENVTVSGLRENVAQLFASAKKQRIFTDPLPMQHAFHSPLMADSAARLQAGLDGIDFANPGLTLISSQSGKVVQHGTEVGSAYWSGHLCNPVMFNQAMQTALGLGATTFIEIGGTAQLAGLAAQITGDEAIAFLPSLRKDKDAWEQLNQTLVTLYQRHYPINWQAYHQDNNSALQGNLPNTAYARSSYWFAPMAGGAAISPAGHSAATQTAQGGWVSSGMPSDAMANNAAAFPGMASVGNAAMNPAMHDSSATTAHTSSAAAEMTRDATASEIAHMVSQISGVDAGSIAPGQPLLRLGIDSLMLVQLNKLIIARFAVDIPVKRFFAEFDNPGKITDYVFANMPQSVRVPAGTAASGEAHANASTTTAFAAGMGSAGGTGMPGAAGATLQQAAMLLPMLASEAGNSPAGSALQAVILSQIQLMREQLAMLRGESALAVSLLPAMQTAGSPASSQAPAQTSLTAASASSIGNASGNTTNNLNHNASGTASAACTPAPLCPLDAPFALSSEERRVYVLNLMKGGEYAYHVTGALRLAGQIDAARIRACFAALAATHAALRTSYFFCEGTVLHQVAASVAAEDIDLVEVDLDGRDLHEVMTALIVPINLNAAPLWRLALIRVNPEEQVLFMDFHHLIADGGSMSILLEDLFALLQGQSLAAPVANYGNFVQWEQRYLASNDAARQKAYWMQRFAPLPPGLELPLDFARPAQNDFAGDTLRFSLSREVWQSVRQLAMAHGATPFMVLLTSYFVFLQKLTRQSDFCVGTPYDRRANGNFERVIGMFAQTLVIRAQPTGDKTFVELLAEVRQACIDAYSHPDCSLEELVVSLNIARDFSRNPLFDTMFVLENGNRRNLSGNGFSAKTLPVQAKGSAFDLRLEMIEEQGELHCALIFATRLFKHERVARWCGYFAQVLQQALAAPDDALAALSMLGQSERSMLLQDFNATKRDYPREETILSRFAASVHASPALPALSFADQTLSYAELDAASTLLARHLLASGVERGQFVAILLPRSVNMIVSMLAVLKAGATYIPLDPDYPAPRVQYMLTHSGVKLMLTQAALAEPLQFGGTPLDPANLPALDATAAQAALPMVWPSDLAYVIFTSGSTGNPKGVMIEHASVANFLHGMSDVLHLPAHAATLGLTTISFDIFVLEVFLTLALGNHLVLASESAQRDPKELLALLREKAVTVMQATPSRVRMLLLGHSAATALAGVQVLLVGGEALPRALLTELQAVPGLRVFNMYGPTETTVWSCVKQVADGSGVVNQEPVTLGRPIANTRVYVLDESGDLRPTGCVGELFIGGLGLARGYLHDDEKTLAAFRTDPFVAGERMYATGDRAAFNDQGELVYHGRADNQIKLRGYRIELAEIDSVLQRFPGIAQVAVAVRELTPNNPVLVAYCVLKADSANASQPTAEASGTGAASESASGSANTLATTPGNRAAADAGRQSSDFPARLRKHAQQALPDYMVPGMVVVLDALPMTPNGKIDVRRLPAVTSDTAADAARPGTDFAPDALEAEILTVWKQILGDRPIGQHDSFFDVGGNSFSLVLMHRALSEKYPDVLEVADIFANPTIAALKEHIEAHLGNSSANAHSTEALLFPVSYFVAGNAEAESGPRAASLAGSLSGEWLDKLQQVASNHGTDPFGLCLALYLLYLNKLLSRSTLELPVVFGTRPEYVLVEIDFAGVRGLAELVAAVREQTQAARWVASKLVRQSVQATTPSTPANGARPLFTLGSGEAWQDGYGFDLLLGVQIEALQVRIRLDFDAAHLDEASMKAFLTNYLKLIKAMLQNSSAKAAPGTVAP